VRAYGAWVEAAGLTEGAVFRTVDRHGNIGSAQITDRGVTLVVKRRAGLAGMDSSEVSVHSLRVGLATAAAAAVVQERVIAQTTGHKSMTVLRRYIREGNLFNENAAAAVGL
jgi:integrase